jgi:hypothetical protein
MMQFVEQIQLLIEKSHIERERENTTTIQNLHFPGDI